MNDTAPLYLVLAMRNPTFDPKAGEAHQAFLSDLGERGLLELTGPFGDRTGGAYLLRVADLAEATRLAQSDPLHLTGSSTLTVHEWRVRRFPSKD